MKGSVCPKLERSGFLRTTRTSPLQTQELTQVILYILLSSETNRLGKTTNYYYNDRGSKVREDFDIYRFSYRDHGELYEVRVNGNVKVTYDYINSGTLKDLLNSVIYNNGDVINYSYDQYGQLTQTADTANGFTESYTYDSRGNILSKTKVYDDENVPAETTNFSYTNSDWQDELTSVNGTPLTYDANGNVLTYGNMEFEWTNGRVLSQITVNLEDPNGTADVYSYTYDESGIRSSKTVNGVTTYFTTKDGVILSQTDGTNTMYFQYDNSGNPTGFIYNGTQYFYLTNQMGDVIGITDNTGSLIATYTYGAWGEVLAVSPATENNSTQLSIANANPLRYRGYYWDAETGYYYLQSRYYNSNLARFINSDLLEIASVEKVEQAGICLFAYCNNGPITGSDPTGTSKTKTIRTTWIIWVVDGLLYLVPALATINRTYKVAGITARKKLIPKMVSIVKKNKKTIENIIIRALQNYMGTNEARKKAVYVAASLAPIIKKITVISSVGAFVEYLVDRTDGKRDHKMKIKVR